MKHTSLSLAVVLLAPLFLIAATSSAVYDPWSDLNADGEIDIFDVVTVAGAYRTTGDPTKSVYVQNWPATIQQTVWFGQESDDYSEWYNASGFGHLHLTWCILGLSAGEAVTVHTRIRIDNPEGGYLTYSAASTNITPANEGGALTVPVPAETFQFHLDIASGTTASVYLAFYLTYA